MAKFKSTYLRFKFFACFTTYDVFYITSNLKFFIP